MFWILATGLTAITAFAILQPLRQGRDKAAPAAAYDLRVYRDQLAEVDRDLDRGVLSPEDAQRLRAEIGRKVLDADRRISEAAPQGRSGRALWPALALALVLAGAVTLYLREGVPGAPDMPLSERMAAADNAYRNRPSQQQAEAQAPARPAPDLSHADPEYLAMIDQLRAAVERNPQDELGLALLATNEMRLGNMTAALNAQQALVDLRGDQADAIQLMQLATLMVDATRGVITPQAEAVLARALEQDPTLPQARYLQGVLLIQNGRPDKAFPIWRRLLEEGPESAPWIPAIRSAIQDLAWLAGDDEYRAPAPVADLPGPDADALSAAGDMSETDRQQMIQDMVARLQDRLATQGGSPDEWARLISALVVLERVDEATAILTEARQRFADNAGALAPIEAAATQSGLAQ